MDTEKRAKILDDLTEVLGMSEGQSLEEIKADIRDEGIDVDAALARLKKVRLNISVTAKDRFEGNVASIIKDIGENK
jgi:hypothetical protein